MNSIWRISLTNLLPPWLSKQHPFPRNRALATEVCVYARVVGTRAAGITRRVHRGFWFHGPHPFVVGHPRICNLKRSLNPSSIPLSSTLFKFFVNFIFLIFLATLCDIRVRVSLICGRQCSLRWNIFKDVCGLDTEHQFLVNTDIWNN